jgi:hypothetical protein
MGVAALVFAGWVSASQSFVTVGKHGYLVHPSPFGWLFVISLVILAGAAYAYLVTYLEWLLPSKWRPVDHSAMYTLALVQSAGTADLSSNPGQMNVGVGLVFTNSGKSILSYRVEEMTAAVGAHRVDHSGFATTGGRLLPGHSRQYTSPLVEVPVSSTVTAEVSYKVSYGPVSGFPRYLRTHRIAVTLFDMDLPEKRGTNNWRELEEETDTITLPAP